MKYMLDTNTCIYIIKRKPVQVVQRLWEAEASDVGISTITLSELEYGVEKSQRRAQNKVALARLTAPFEIAPYDGLAAQEYGRIRGLLESRGQPIGPLDTLIAAHALSLGCTLVTNNVREFSRIPGLRLENWADPDT